MTKFYDTCSLLLMANHLFDNEEDKVVISSITLDELEHIKTAVNKDPDVKFAARRIIKLLDEYDGEYDVHIYREKMLNPIREQDLEITNDVKILATAIDYQKENGQIAFVTNDGCLRRIARLFFDNDYIWQVAEDIDDTYHGYQEIQLSDEEMANFYMYPNINHFDSIPNEYIILKDATGLQVDTRVWTGDTYRALNFKTFESNQFGKVKPVDIQQQMAADSFMNNKITMIKGPAGSGKSLLSLGFYFYLLERNRIDKIIIFCNTVAAKNSAKLGYLPGSRDEKLLDSQIGNFLVSKLGSRIAVEHLINSEKLILLPMSDIRGYDTSGMQAGIYISEAQNLDIPLMKLALQRIGKDSLCIIDGDEKTQVDDISFAGTNNGMRRVSQIFRGEDIYGEVELKTIHRSRIGQIAERM